MNDAGKKVAGRLVAECEVVGVIAVIGAVAAVVKDGTKHPETAALCLIAAAIAFGFAVNAVLRR